MYRKPNPNLGNTPTQDMTNSFFVVCLLLSKTVVCSRYADEDADVDESSNSDDENDHDEKRRALKIGLQRMLGMVEYLFPYVGLSVQVLSLGCSPVLSNGLVSFKLLLYSLSFILILKLIITTNQSAIVIIKLNCLATIFLIRPH